MIRNTNPHQQEIEFFWPLTEQIPLGLDFKGCDTRRALTVDIEYGTGSTVCAAFGNPNTAWSTCITADKLQTEEITFTLNKKPFIIKRLMYKLLGFKWKVQ